MMKNLKNIVSLFVLFVFCCGINNVYGQTSSMKSAVKFSKEDQIKSLQAQVKIAGEYEVVVIDPRGKVIARPVQAASMLENGTINFDINTKLWTPGSYTIVTRSERGVANTQRFRILPYSMQ